MMLILTGEKGSGKTTLVRNILVRHGIDAQGFLSVKEFQGNEITGISLIILPENRRVPMAVTTPMATDACTTRFYFFPGVFEQVNRRFREINRKVPFILDEFGHLEKEGKGHYPIFSSLRESSHPSLVLVQKALAEDLTSMFEAPDMYLIADMDTESKASAASCVEAFLKGAFIP